MSLNLTPSLAIFSCSICHEVRDFAPLNVPTMIFSVHHACAWDKMEHSNCAGLSENGPQKFIESGIIKSVSLLEEVWQWGNLSDVQARPSILLFLLPADANVEFSAPLQHHVCLHAPISHPDNKWTK